MTCSPALALNVVNYKTQNFQTILKPEIAKSNETVSNDIIVQAVSSYHFYFQARLVNSTYNGFPGFMSQIKIEGFTWPFYLLQWLDDDDFSTTCFPQLKYHTQHGFYHDPMVWANRLEEHMGHFGGWLDDKSETAYHMITGSDPKHYLQDFGANVEKAYTQATKTGKVAGIMMNFGFTFDGTNYAVVKPNYDLMMNP